MYVQLRSGKKEKIFAPALLLAAFGMGMTSTVRNLCSDQDAQRHKRSEASPIWAHYPELPVHQIPSAVDAFSLFYFLKTPLRLVLSSTIC